MTSGGDLSHVQSVEVRRVSNEVRGDVRTVVTGSKALYWRRADSTDCYWHISSVSHAKGTARVAADSHGVAGGATAADSHGVANRTGIAEGTNVTNRDCVADSATVADTFCVGGDAADSDCVAVRSSTAASDCVAGSGDSTSTAGTGSRHQDKLAAAVLARAGRQG